MTQADKGMGFEFVCRATDCKFNDLPACKRHTERNPVVIGPGGQCSKYEKNDESGGNSA